MLKLSFNFTNELLKQKAAELSEYSATGFLKEIRKKLSNLRVSDIDRIYFYRGERLESQNGPGKYSIIVYYENTSFDRNGNKILTSPYNNDGLIKLFTKEFDDKEKTIALFENIKEKLIEETSYSDNYPFVAANESDEERFYMKLS